MSKMKRRDYLKHMVIGAAAIAGSRLDVFGQRSRRRPRQPTTLREESKTETIDALAENFQQWPGTQTRPTNPPILVTFHGLVDFYYNSSGSNAGTCGVGFHRGGGHHTPNVEVFEDGVSIDGRPTRIDNNSEVTLGIVNSLSQPQPPRVEFLKNGSAEDFRWLIDMQSRSWYPGTRTKSAYAARLFVRHGTFLTRKRTLYLLDRVIKVEASGLSYLPAGALGTPAEIVGDEISLAGTDKVSLKVNGQETLLPRSPTKKYEVRFTNMCTSHGPCDFYWWDFQEVRRNDFHHHRDALDLPGFSAKYSVVLAPGQLPVGTRDPGRGRVRMTNSNDAPCMGAGYGGGNGPP